MALLALLTVCVPAGAAPQGEDPLLAPVATPGVPEVSAAHGLATVSFPIEVPPGRRGMQPRLALRYSSGDATGEAGAGFALEIGSIRRSTRFGPPRFDNSDTFTLALDGSTYDLIAIDGDSTRFRTAIDSGFLIERLTPGPFGPGSSFWIARGRDGRFYRFGAVGNPPASRASQVPDLEWGLDRVEDTSGNVMEIAYEVAGNHLFAVRIDYAAHPATGLAASNAVDLCWEGRGDQAPRLWGERIPFRLSAVTTSAAGAIARVYALDYDTAHDFNRLGTCPPADPPPSGDPGGGRHDEPRAPRQPPGRHPTFDGGSSIASSASSGDSTASTAPLPPHDSRLIRIRRRDGAGSTLPPIEYAYGIDAAIGWPAAQPGGEPPVPFVYTRPEADEDAGARFVDVNRDGLPDLLRLTGHVVGFAAAAEYGVYLNSGTGFVHDPDWSASLLNLVRPFDPGGSAFFVLRRGSRHPMDNGVRFLDVNDDGYMDVVRIASYFGQGIRKSVHLNTGSGFTADVGGSWPLPDEPFVRMHEIEDQDFGEDLGVRIVDVNGDGRADLARSRARNWGSADSRVYVHDRGAYRHDPDWILPDEPFVRQFGDGFWLDMGVRFIHLDRDGYIDLFKAVNLNGIVTNCAYLHTRSPGRSRPTWYPGGNEWLLTPLGEAFVDVYTSGRGAVFDRGLRIADVNADGVGDVVVARSLHGGPDERFLYSPQSNGGWTYRVLHEFPGLFIVRPPGEIPRDQGVRLVDIDGDGGVDYVASPESGTREWRRNTAWRGRGVMTSHTNGIGGLTRIEYAPAPHGGSADEARDAALPFPLPVVRSVTVSDGMGHDYTTRYEYSGGFYHHAARDFRGFHRVSVIEPGNGLMIETRYAQQPSLAAAPLNGAPLGRVARRSSDGALFESTVWTYDTRDEVPPLAHALARTESALYEWVEGAEDGAAPVHRTAISYERTYAPGPHPDAPLLRLLEHHEGDVGDPADDRFAVEEYLFALDAGAAAGPEGGRWFLDLPYHRTLADSQGTILSESWIAYDERPIGAIGSRGLPTREEERGGQPGPPGAVLPGDPSNAATARRYDPCGNVAEEIDPLGRSRRIGRGLVDPSLTYPEQETDPLGGITLREFDPRTGLVTRAVDPNGRAVHIVYDGFGRRVSEYGPYDSPEKPTVSYLHDYGAMPARVHRYARERSGLGETAGSAGTLESIALFDGLGRLLQTRTEAANGAMTVTTAVTFDAAGRIETRAEPFFAAPVPAYVPTASAPHRTRYVHDAAGRRTAVIDPAGAIRRIERRGAIASWIDPLGHRRDVERDAFGNIVRVEEFDGVEGSWQSSTTAAYRYDAADRLIGITDPSKATIALAYDALGRRTALHDPHLGSWRYEYDRAGNLTGEIDPLGRRTALVYDALDRPVSRSLADGGWARWNYDEGGAAADAIGRLTSIEDTSGTQWLSYDAMGRVIETTRLLGGRHYSVRTTYDARSRVTSMEAPGGPSLIYEYDRGGNLSAALPFAPTFEYDAAGRLTRTALANGVSVLRTYDDATGRPEQIRALRPDGAPLLHLTYGFLADGQIGTITDLTDPSDPRITSYHYDGIHRLTRALMSGDDRRYLYDPMGNLLLKDGAGSFYDDPLHPQWITRTSTGRSVTHDALGQIVRVLGDGLDRRMEYDAAGRMVRLSDPVSDLIVSNDYDASGRRVREVVERDGSRTTRLVPFPPLEDRDGHMTWHLFAGSMRIATVDPNRGTLFPITDHLGSTRVVADESGLAIARFDYTPHGALMVPPSGAPEVSHLYASGERQADTGLILMGQRHYDPALGRFLQPDPIVADPSDPQSLNRYAYARNDPINLVDPRGESPLTAFLLIGAIALLDRETRGDVAGSVALTAASIFLTGALGPGPAQGLRALLASTPALYAAAVTPVILNSRLGQVIIQSYAMLFQDLGLSARNSAIAARVVATLLLNSHLQRGFARALAPRGEVRAGRSIGTGRAFDDYLASRGADRLSLRTVSGEAFGTPIQGAGAVQDGGLRLDRAGELLDESGNVVGVFGVRDLGGTFEHGAVGFLPAATHGRSPIVPRRHYAYGLGGVSTQQFAREVFAAGFSGTLFTLTGRATSFLVEFLYGPYGGGLVLGVDAASGGRDRDGESR